MKKIRNVIIAMVFVAVMTMVFVGCSSVEQQEEKSPYFDYGTHTYSLSILNEYERHGVTFWLPDMLEGRENNDKYVEFWGENGLKERQEYYYYMGYYDIGSMLLHRQSYNTTHTIKNVSEIAAENITFVNGKDKLSPGEILVHKWDYLNMCLSFSGLYVSGQTLDEKVIVSDNVLPKYIMTLSTHGSICNFGLAADYYNLISFGSSPAHIHYKDDIVVEIGDGTSAGPKAEYKVAGYYVNPTDAEFLAETYTMDQFANVTQSDILANVPMTKTEKAIEKKIKSITIPVYVCNEEQI